LRLTGKISLKLDSNSSWLSEYQNTANSVDTARVLRLKFLLFQIATNKPMISWLRTCGRVT